MSSLKDKLRLKLSRKSGGDVPQGIQAAKTSSSGSGAATSKEPTARTTTLAGAAAHPGHGASAAKVENVVKNDAQLQSTSTTAQPDQAASSGPAAVQSDTATKPSNLQNVDRSAELWNEAHNQLEGDEETANVFNAYRETLAELLTNEELEARKAAAPVTGTATVPSKEDPAVRNAIKANKLDQLRDRTQRQELLNRFVEEGRDKIKLRKMGERIGTVAEAILKAQPVVNIALQVPHAAPAALPWAGVVVGLQILANPGKAKKANLDGISYVSARMEWYYALCNFLLDNKSHESPEKNDSFQLIQQQLKDRIIYLYKAILFYQMKSVCVYYKNRGLVFLQGLSNWNDWEGLLKEVIDAERALEKDSTQFRDEQEKLALSRLVDSAQVRETELKAMHKDIHRALEDQLTFQKGLREDQKNRAYFEDIYVTNPQETMARIERKKGGLLNEVFKWVLDNPQYILLTDSNRSVTGSPNQLLWIKGHAGTGKTMLMIGIIRELSGQLANSAPSIAYFFCQGTIERAQNGATAILRSLIWMLLAQQPDLMTHLQLEYERQHSDHIFSKDKDALDTVSRIFKKILADAESVYFIVDALDECDETLDDFIKLISISLRCSKNVKWILSSRPNTDVHARLRELGHHNLEAAATVLDLNTQKLEGPVNLYIEHKLSSLKGRPGYNDEVLSTIYNEVRGRKEKTFLWVALVFEVLDERDEDLTLPLGSDALEIIKEIPQGLTELYNHMMIRIERKKRKAPELCKSILAVVALARRPLSFTELSILAGLQSKGLEPQAIVMKCGSFLITETDMVYLVHQSAKEYLLEKLRNTEGDSSSTLDTTTMETHVNITSRSIAAMSMLYEARCYQFSAVDKPLSRRDLGPLQYSVLYWIDHLTDSAKDISAVDKAGHKDVLTLCDNTFKYLRSHLLQWLESLFLLRKTLDGIVSLEKLTNATKLSAMDADFTRFLDDVKKFTVFNRFIIEQAPLQLYGAALAFCPTKSEVRKLFWNQRLPYIKRIYGSDRNFGLAVEALPVAREYYCVAFSHDGILLATGSPGSVQLWDVESATISKTLTGFADRIRTIVFSNDDETVAIALSSGDIDVRTIRTDSQMIVKSDAQRITSVAFSPNKTSMAVASGNATLVQLCDLKTGSKHPLEGHTSPVNSVAFSKNSTLASGSRDGTIRLWDGKSGAFQRSLRKGAKAIDSIIFSNDGLTIAAVVNASWSETIYPYEIQLWKPESDEDPKVLKGHRHNIATVAFSKDDAMLASASDDRRVQLWNVKTGQSRQIIDEKGLLADFAVVAFLHDGSKLALASSNDGEMQLQITDTVDSLSNFPGSINPTTLVAFSGNDKTMASASSNGIVRLWDADTGTQEQTLELRDTRGFLQLIALSMDGTMLAAYSGETIRVWSLERDNHSLVLSYVADRPAQLVFSANSETFVSRMASRLGGLSVWSIRDRKRMWGFEGHWRTDDAPDGESPGYDNKSVIISADSQILATAHSANVVRIWSVDSGHLVRKISATSDIGPLISFSSDNSSLITDRGTLAVDGIADAISSNMEAIEDSSTPDSAPFTPHSEPLSASALYVEQPWIFRGSKPLLWLPPNYRARSHAVQHGIVALGHDSGDVTIIHFDLEAEDRIDIDAKGRRKWADSEDADLESIETSSSASDVESEDEKSIDVTLGPSTLTV